MPLEYRSTGQDPETWKALEKQAKARSIKVDALLREFVAVALAGGSSSSVAQAPTSTSSLAVLPPGTYFIKDGVLSQHFGTFDSDLGTVDEVVKAFKDSKYIDQEKIHEALRWGDFSRLSEAEKKSAKLDQDLLLGNAKIAEAVNKAKAARGPPRALGRGDSGQDRDRYRTCSGCGKLYGNMSGDERRAHGGRDCERRESSGFSRSQIPDNLSESEKRAILDYRPTDAELGVDGR